MPMPMLARVAGQQPVQGGVSGWRALPGAVRSRRYQPPLPRVRVGAQGVALLPRPAVAARTAPCLRGVRLALWQRVAAQRQRSPLAGAPYRLPGAAAPPVAAVWPGPSAPRPAHWPAPVPRHRPSTTAHRVGKTVPSMQQRFSPPLPGPNVLAVAAPGVRGRPAQARRGSRTWWWLSGRWWFAGAVRPRRPVGWPARRWRAGPCRRRAGHAVAGRPARGR